MRNRSILLAAAAIALLPFPASAHRMWLLPSTTTLADTNQWVTVDAAVSNDLFYPDHFPMPTDQIRVWAPDGTEGAIENAARGRYRSTFDVKIDKPGTWKIGTESASVMGSFKVGGEEWRVGGRRGPGGPGGQGPSGPGGQGGTAAAAQNRPVASGASTGPGAQAGPARRSVATVAEIPANATDVKLTEVSGRNVVFVTAGEPSTTVFKPSNKGLELQPVSHPDALVQDEPGRFRFLVDGKPAAGVKVTVVPGGKRFREAEGAQELTTGADGSLSVNWRVAGMYWMSATLTDAHPTLPRATERRMTYTTTLEVVAP